MHRKKWIYKEIPEENILNELTEKVTKDRNLAILLAQRGISNFEEAKKFFRPSYIDLHNPYLMKDMDKAVSRICKAISTQENILVYGDYDVDGTTSVALMYTFLKETLNYENVSYYIPDRYKEGYGVSTDGINFAADNNFNLIISLDCGIKSVDKVDLALSMGIDFIICDHHLPGKTLPNAVAILNPKQSDCNYPYKELSGCGVGFKLIQAIGKKKEIDDKQIIPFLDLVVVSIGADIVPITEENRILASLGIEVINTQPRPGLKKMIEEKFSVKLKDPNFRLDIEDIVFGIAPTINAAGRMAHAHDSVTLLISKDDKMLNKQFVHLKEHNAHRQKVGEDMIKNISSLFEKDQSFQSRKTTVVYHPSWSKGVVGIVASKLIENYFFRPTVVFGQHEGKISGSARSVPGFDVYEAIELCSDLLENYGGHKYAAGLTLLEKNLAEFTTRFEEIVASKITDEQLTPTVDIDLLIEFDDINDKFLRILKQLGPFGPGNMNPTFATHQVSCKDQPQLFKDQHLKFTAFKSETDFNCIGFKMPHFFDLLQTNSNFSLAYTIKENVWNSKTYTNLEIKDLIF